MIDIDITEVLDDEDELKIQGYLYFFFKFFCVQTKMG